MANTTYNYGVRPGEGANRESLRGGRVAGMKRKMPSGVMKGRAGNYAADVDTAGMDPEMKGTLSTENPGVARLKRGVAKVKSLFQKKK